MQDKAPITDELVKAIHDTVTTHIEGSVTVVENANKKLNRDNYERYKIRDFYKKGSIITTLKGVKLKSKWFKHSLLSNHSYGDKDAFIDNEAIKKQLLEHPDKILEFYEGVKDAELLVSHRNNLPPYNTDKFKPLDEFVKEGERTFTEKVTQKQVDEWQSTIDSINAKKHTDGTPYTEDEKRHIVGYTIPKPEIGKTTKHTFKGYVVDDAKGLLEAIKAYPLYNSYQIVNNYDSYGSSVLGGELLRVYDLAKACGIIPQADYVEITFNTDGDKKEIMPDHRVILDYLTIALAEQLTPYLKLLDNSRRPSTPVNIRKEYHGDYIPKPPIDSTIKDIENPNPDKYKTLSTIYRTNEAIKQENGLFATITDPTLFDLLPIEYQDPIKLLSLYNRSNRRGLVTCFRYAEDNPNPPSELKIEELAKYNGAYAEQIAKNPKGNYLPQFYREQLLNELIMVKGTNTFYSYFDKKLQKEMIGSIRFFDFDISTDGKIITNFRYTDEYIRALHNKKQAMLHLAIPKGIDLLNQTAQDIAYKIIQKFVDGRQMKKTIEGKPLTMLLTDLYKGVLETARTKQQRAKRKDKTVKALDDIKETNEVIRDYKLEYKSKKWYVVLYPAEYMQKAYKDTKLNTALEQQYRDDQAKRQADLERLVGHFKQDFNSKSDHKAYLDELAIALGITQEQLAEFRIKPNKKTKVYPTEITDDLYTKIKDQLNYYEGK